VAKVAHLTPEWVALHEGLGAALPERPGASARLQHVVTGAPAVGPKGELAYTVEIVDGRVAATRFGRDDEAADCTFLIAHKDSVAIAKGELDLHAGFMLGRVNMRGWGGPLLEVLRCTVSPEYRELRLAVAAQTEF
jgi:hypothetical protein